jgi:hypothetical protein
MTSTNANDPFAGIPNSDDADAQPLLPANPPADAAIRVQLQTLRQVDQRLGATYSRVRRDLDSVTAFYATKVEETVAEVTARKDAERQALEDSRANHRNLNRMLTLLGALVIGLVVTFVLYHAAKFHLPHWMLGMAPYSFVITIMLDSGLAAYSLIRHY